MTVVKDILIAWLSRLHYCCIASPSCSHGLWTQSEKKVLIAIYGEILLSMDRSQNPLLENAGVYPLKVNA
jgi:hypothetical protein